MYTFIKTHRTVHLQLMYFVLDKLNLKTVDFKFKQIKSVSISYAMYCSRNHAEMNKTCF